MTTRAWIKRKLPQRWVHRLAVARRLALLAASDIRREILNPIFPKKPTGISMMVNDICNSRCQMCLIWEKKRDHEITPDELRQVLAEPLFKEIQYIGVTGGEPTLRRDLPDLFRVIVDKKPRLHATSIITNSIRADEVQERILECSRICAEAKVDFSVMVSLDGIGAVHDAVRGRNGNFESAVSSLKRFRSEGVPVDFGCTITTSNAPYVDQLLDWAIENGFYGRFRVAEFIERLYNTPQKQFIRSFDPLTQYHLGLFFFRLEHEFETQPKQLKMYRAIRGILVENRTREMGCPYHHDAVILTSRGELLYCSPKSPNLGSILEKGSAATVFFGNLGKRREIREKHCDNCIHDYQVPETIREKASFFFKHRRIQRRYNCGGLIARADRIPSARELTVDPMSLTSKRVLITGWYGTETAGDKAILWGVIQRLRRRKTPPTEIFVSSLHPFITRWTCREMNLEPLRIVETYSRDFEQVCREADEIIVGGGPLMDLEALNHILYALIEGSRNNAVTRVEGCGIGPLKKPLYQDVVRHLLRLSNQVTLRDAASVKHSQSSFNRSATREDDPAIEYTEHILKTRAGSTATAGSEPVVNFFLRDLPREYTTTLTDSAFADLTSGVEKQLLLWMADIVSKQGCKIRLLPMHCFTIGGDDRIFNRRLARLLIRNHSIPESSISLPELPVSPEQICNEMLGATMNVCMRYHSVFFAESLGANYLALDYTSGGKIEAFLRDSGKLSRLINLSDLASGNWRNHPLVSALAPSVEAD